MATCFRVAVMSSSGVSGPVTCTGEPVEDVTISCDPHTTLIGDLAELVGFGRGPLLVDGRRFPPSATVAETTLTDGSVMGTPCHPGRSVATSGRGPVVWVETIAGESSGHSQSLPVGRFHLTLQGPDLEVTGARTAETRILLDIGESWVTIRAGNSPVVVDGSLLEQPIAIRPGDGPIVNLGDTRLRISPWLKPPGRTESDGAVHRVPRVPLVAPDPSFATDVTPSAAAEPQPLSWISFAAPIPAAMIMAIALGRMIFMLFAILSPMALIGRWYDGKRRHRKQQAQYELDLQLLRLDAFDQIMKARVDATSYARAKHPDPVQVVQRAIRTDPRLWERRPQHDDFAHVAVAVGEPAWHFEPPLPSPVEDLAEAINYLTSAPIPVDLKAGPLGIVGPRSRVLAAARAAIVELAALSGPVDLPIAVIAPDDRVPDWDWTKWLPHLGSPPRVATTSQAVGSVLDPLRTTGHTATNTATPEGPLAVLVIDGIDLLRRHDSPLRTALADDSRISAIVIADNEADLPASCTWILNIDLDGIGAVSDLATGRRTEHVTPVGMDTSTATEAARALSRLTDPDGPATTAQLRTQVALPSVTGPIDAASVLHRWAAEGIDPNPTATIGTGTAGPLEIDLVHDGPHALLAGTTGAGKSELLRSFVLSIATRYSAETVNFVLVDYKGGGAFDACADLPHTVAVVTDLDGHLGARALRSLQAELRFREMTFRESGAHDLKSYRSKTGPMPRLVVVVDEFATLASDLPDVLDALVDIAQRGRSLGIHMVLATQRPAGIVDAKIKSNTNLRISLRVQDDSDSQDVLGTNHAARLGRSELGRGFVRMGAGDVVPFQAAYSGGVTPDPASRSGATIEPFRLVPGVLDSAGETEGQPSDLVRMVHEIGLAHEKAQIGETRKPWLPVLNSSIGIDELPVGTGVVIGILDVPAEQRRQELAVPLGSEHVLVFGVDQRETAASLRTIALRAMTEFHPDDLHVYLIDSGSRSLGAFRAAPAVGGYVVHDDAGRLDRMLTLLES
ncbi:MAG: FtsK/SpoIIIE domain-containing protein, partial [Acidimicrobiales bacterium]